MRMKCLITGLAAAGGVSAAVAVVATSYSTEPVLPTLAEAGVWEPAPLTPPRFVEGPSYRLARTRPGSAPDFRPPFLPAVVRNDAPLTAIEPPLITWSRKMARGETLDAVLAEAGLAATDRAEIALAIGAEYDLRRLRPGHAITVISTTDGSPRNVTLVVEEGIRIEALFGEQLATRVVAPEPEIVTLAGETRIETSIFGALDDAGIPARFAVDLAQMLGGTVDFRRELSGGETLRLLWREARVANKAVRQPEISFAALDLGDALYEIAWPEDGTGKATIYLDGEVLRVFSQPVEGARLTSVFGRRKHPVFGNVRMHTGVDFAAARGTPVRATAPGSIAFIGWRGGYGRVVEIAHGADKLTRYAHLSAVPEGLAEGQRVSAGDTIGRIGATGTATGPNLHYEVRVDGRPTDPLSDDRLAEAAGRATPDTAALTRLRAARARLEEQLASVIAANPNERL
ncbi:M23 family metallopeptidase (plasmid) [Leisingera aquaemixtae]|uniref:M23 family metallopeptidase n=1 Tax=Leisingera aquaemixtae TaxID=1396826 RepID=A0ABY5WR49_9RHOB|nr:M23 family metallopeptidase [Leisingera aquaemixtae]UWQ43992.1 M23 family metallopeptidase [Leisingera aquaemixtae]